MYPSPLFHCADRVAHFQTKRDHGPSCNQSVADKFPRLPAQSECWLQSKTCPSSFEHHRLTNIGEKRATKTAKILSEHKQEKMPPFLAVIRACNCIMQQLQYLTFSNCPSQCAPLGRYQTSANSRLIAGTIPHLLCHRVYSRRSKTFSERLRAFLRF